MGRRTRATDPSKTATKVKPSPVETRQIAHPRVWDTAIKLAEGNVTLIKVEAFARVTVILPR